MSQIRLPKPPLLREALSTTKAVYRDINGRIWKKHTPANFKIKTERHLVNLGVDINDVWIVAVAWKHGLVFVTTDKMTCIKEAVSKEVQFGCWIESPKE